jgi:hypothetical protein
MQGGDNVQVTKKLDVVQWPRKSYPPWTTNDGTKWRSRTSEQINFKVNVKNNETRVFQLHSQVETKRVNWVLWLATVIVFLDFGIENSSCLVLLLIKVKLQEKLGFVSCLRPLPFGNLEIESAFPPSLTGQSGCILLQDHLERARKVFFKATLCIALTCAPINRLDAVCPW